MRSIQIFFACCMVISPVFFSVAAVGNDLDFKKAAIQIDAYILKDLQENQLSPNAIISDEKFVRRIFLATIGRIPTVKESTEFLNSKDSDKHSLLIQELLANDAAYTAHHFHFWADLLRVPSGQHWSLIYREWIKQQIYANTPYDEFAKRLVSGHGLVFDDPAAAYYIRDTGMPLDNMSNTVRVFLGTRLECAQCHDHPFDQWTQMDFYKMAAFTYDFDHRGGGVNRSKMLTALTREEKMSFLQAIPIDGFPYFRNQEQLNTYLTKPHASKFLAQHGLSENEFRDLVEEGMEAEEKLRVFNEPIRQNISQLGNHITYTQVRNLDRPLQLPHDYQYGDAEPHDVVLPQTMFGSAIPSLTDPLARKRAYAQWLTSADNPRFTRIIVNRIWKRTFGYGIFEPVDDLTESTPVVLSDLLDYLEDLMRSVDYDLRKFQCILFHTDLFRREANREDHPLGMPFQFTGPSMRRMSAEQIWDSICTLILPNVDLHSPNQKKLLRRIEETRGKHRSLEQRPMEEVLARMRIAGDRTRQLNKERNRVEDLIVAAYDAGNSDQAQRLTMELREKERAVDRLNRETVFVDVQGGGQGDSAMMQQDNLAASEATDQTLTFIKGVAARKAPSDLSDQERKDWLEKEQEAVKSFREVARGMARAVDLDSPARRGHFLRDFGQSDRDVIDNASSNASVPQSLYLLNSPLASAIYFRGSVLGMELEKHENLNDKIATIYQAMLTRSPSQGETQRVLAEYEQYGDEALEDLIWALLNSSQFLFVQ